MSISCEVCYEDAPLICSGCKVARYCSQECQILDWKERNHKKGCKIQQALNKFSAEQKAKRPERPATGRCTGCNVKFDEDELCEDNCEACGYQTCESCSVHKSKGTCYCQNANFGTPYCKWPPRFHHFDGYTGTMYMGDRHPPIDPFEFTENDFEAVTRKCNNCGEIKKMLKPGKSKPVM